MRLITCVLVFLATVLLNSAIYAQGFFEQEPYDPIENINRKSHEFNKGLDRYALRPTSNIYGAYVPEFIRTPISNFRGNLNEPKRFWQCRNGSQQIYYQFHARNWWIDRCCVYVEYLPNIYRF